MDGIINIYKEKGYTSFDVVAILRKELNERKIGHLGTLDPDAEGVLPVCIGKATKLADVMQSADKTYEALLKLGVSTDTLDMSGKIIEEIDMSDISESEIQKCIMSFTGSYMQTPPMYCAKKVSGKKLYELARKGGVIDRKPVKVSIYNIKIISIYYPYVRFAVCCSKGTYIRSLCDDIGKKLNGCAAMDSLIRKKAGIFTIEDSYTLAEIKSLNKNGLLENAILGIEDITSCYEKIRVQKKYDKYLYNGNKLPIAYVYDITCKKDIIPGYGEIGHDSGSLFRSKNLESIYRVYDSKDKFKSLYKLENDVLVPFKVFYTE